MCVLFQFSLQMDLIRQQLEFEAQQVQSVMEEHFGTSDEVVQRTRVRNSLLFMLLLLQQIMSFNHFMNNATES